MNKKKFLLIISFVIVIIAIPTIFIPEYLDDAKIEAAFNNSFGGYNDLWLYDTYFDGLNQQVIIKTPYNSMKNINEAELIDTSKKFMSEIKKYDIPENVESIWIIYTNDNGNSIGSMWTYSDYIKKTKWNKISEEQFKKAMNYK